MGRMVYPVLSFCLDDNKVKKMCAHTQNATMVIIWSQNKVRLYDEKSTQTIVCILYWIIKKAAPGAVWEKTWWLSKQFLYLDMFI